MATKTNLINSVNNFITAIVTIVKHRNSMSEVINEFYKLPQTETNNVNGIATKNLNNNISYSFLHVKQGGKVTISGSITNLTNGIIQSGSNDWVFEITNAEYFPNESLATPYIAFNDTGVNSSVFFLNNKLFCSNIPANENLYFNITYFVNG